MPQGKILLYPYKYNVILNDWDFRYRWISDALKEKGYEVFIHDDLDIDLDCDRISKEKSKEISFTACIFNHCDLAEVKTFPQKRENDFFLKPTTPDSSQTTLDELGYGSYSSITYEKPDHEIIPSDIVDNFFCTKVKSWITQNQSKWGQHHFETRGNLEIENYLLVLGQCGGDSVVNRQDFGGYFEKLKKICKELSLIQNDHIIVKLHPYTNGKGSKRGQFDRDIASSLKIELESYSKKIRVDTGFRSIHDYLPNAKCVILGNSGAGFEAMMYSKPIISFCFPEYHWVTYDLRKTCDLHRAIETKSWFDPDLSDKFLYWYMVEYCFYDKESARRRLDNLLDYETIYTRVR